MQAGDRIRSRASIAFSHSAKPSIINPMPTPVLAFVYLLHLLATVMWVGGLATMTLVAWPGLQRVFADEAGRAEPILDAFERRFRPFANISLVVLVVTGLLQMGADTSYEGLLAISNTWSVSLLLKHLVVGAMIAVSAIMQWGTRPALERAALLARRSTEQPSAATVAVRRRYRRLTALNLVLGVLVLTLTAVMTAQ
jgi:uncharacterized membrane protein